jgi:hypothetical protein
VWKDEYLYLSFISDLTPSTTTPRDIFLGFRRVNPISTPVVENGYIFQIHIETDAIHAAKQVPFCTKWNASFGCGDATVKPVYWRVFADLGVDKDCGALVMKRQFKQIANPGWVDGNVHSWQLADGRWAVQLRIKFDNTSTAASPSPLSKGIELGSPWWYEATESANPNGLLSLGKHPSNAGAICRRQQNLADEIVHETLKDQTSWAGLAFIPNGAARPADCDNGLYVDRGHLGAVFDNAGPYDTIGLTKDIKARRANNTPAPNTIVAQVVNATGAPFTGKLRGRFKLADWGATVPGVGDWIDIPADAGTTNPAERSVTNLANGSQAALSFNWTLKDTDYCKYGLDVTKFPGYSCPVCSPCSDTANGCTQVQRPDGSKGPCQPVKTRSHQCMQVELTAPNAAVSFSQSSVFNNMDFGEMSKFSREATIDVTGLSGTGAHEVILAVVPRNLPAPPNHHAVVTSGLELLANNSLRLARSIALVHKRTIDRMRPDDIKKRKTGRTPLTNASVRTNTGLARLGVSDVVAFDKSRIALPEREYAVTTELLDLASRAADPTGTPAAELTRRIVANVGPGLAAKVAPVIEVYPFYKPAIGDVYQPMRAFAVFLSHDGPTIGFKVSDLSGPGVTKLSTNIYKLTIPAGTTKAKVTLEAESVDPPTPTTHLPQNPHTPSPPSTIRPIKPNWKLKL